MLDLVLGKLFLEERVHGTEQRFFGARLGCLAAPAAKSGGKGLFLMAEKQNTKGQGLKQQIEAVLK